MGPTVFLFPFPSGSEHTNVLYRMHRVQYTQLLGLEGLEAARGTLPSGPQNNPSHIAAGRSVYSGLLVCVGFCFLGFRGQATLWPDYPTPSTPHRKEIARVNVQTAARLLLDRC